MPETSDRIDHEQAASIRARIVDVLELIADVQGQVRYQAAVPPGVNVSNELFNRWGDWYRASNPSLLGVFNRRELAALEAFAAVLDRAADETPPVLPLIPEFMRSHAWGQLQSAAVKALVALATAPRSE